MPASLALSFCCAFTEFCLVNTRVKFFTEAGNAHDPGKETRTA